MRLSRFAIIGDIHESMNRLMQVVDALSEHAFDAVLLAGDIAEAGYTRTRTPERTARWRAQVAAVLKLVETLGKPVVWIPGNHDCRDWSDHPQNIDRRLVTLAGATVFGLGGGGPARFGFQYEWDDAEIAAVPVPNVDILLSHTPPLGTLDQANRGVAPPESVGSWAVRDHANRARVLVCGHIHEAQGVELLDTCVVVNAGSLGPPFASTHFTLVELDLTAVRVEQRNVITGRVEEWAFENGQLIASRVQA